MEEGEVGWRGGEKHKWDIAVPGLGARKNVHLSEASVVMLRLRTTG